MITDRIMPAQNKYQPSFNGIKILPYAKARITENLPEFQSGKTNMDSIFAFIESIKINYLEFITKKSQKNAEFFNNVDIILHDEKINSATGKRTYIYSIPKFGKGLHAIETKRSIIKNPVDIYKQILKESHAEDVAAFKSF